MDICLWDKCNNNCIMCTNPDNGWEAWDGSFNYDFKSLKKRIIEDKQRFEAGDTIYITGGEPTIHPDFIEIIKFINTEFPDKRIILLTNGRRFYYKDFAKELLEVCPNIEIHMSLYGHNQEIHEKITQAVGSYSQTIAGITNLLNLKKRGQVIALRHVLSSVSHKHINDFLKLVSEKFPQIDQTILMFWEIEAQAEKNIESLKLRYKDTEAIIGVVEEYLEKLKEIRLYHFPLCQIEKNLWPITWCTWPAHEVCFLPACDKCKVKKYCVGVHKAYLKNIGPDEFSPITEEHKIKESKNQYKPIESIK